MSDKADKKIDFEIARERNRWFKVAKARGWDDDIRDCGWRMYETGLKAAKMRRAKVRKHDDERTLLNGVKSDV